MDGLREKIADTIRKYDPERDVAENLADDIMAWCDFAFADQTTAAEWENYRSTVLDIETRQQ
jgi:hypothetical protein